jgi:hypothetical protein
LCASLKGYNLKQYFKLVMYILAALALVSLCGLVFALTIPAQSESKITRLSYEHTGNFDYRAYLKPSYLLGPEPQPSTTVSPSPTASPVPQSALKYPVNMIERFNFVYDYIFTPEKPVKKITQQISAVASGTGVDKETKTLELLPEMSLESTAVRAQFFLAVNNDFTGDITLNIYNYPIIQTEEGFIFESFLQTLTLKKEGSVFTLDRKDLQKKLSGRQGSLVYLQEGKVDYTVLFKNGSVPGAIEVPLPAVPPPTPSLAPEPLPLKEVRPGDAIYTKLLNNIDASFHYQLKGGQAIKNLEEEATVTAVIEGVKAWSKTVVIVPATRQNGAFTLKFPIDLNQYSRLIENIRNETGAAADSYLITIRADVHVTGDTGYGRLDEVFSPALTTTLDKNILSWNEKMAQSKPGAVETIETVPNTGRYLGLSRGEIRELTLALFIIFLAAFLVLLFWSSKFRPVETPQLENERLKLQKKYGQRIAEASVIPQSDTESRISLNTMEDLIKIADELGKPIVHQPPSIADGPHSYLVYDSSATYRYALKSPDKAPNKGIEEDGKIASEVLDQTQPAGENTFRGVIRKIVRILPNKNK